MVIWVPEGPMSQQHLVRRAPATLLILLASSSPRLPQKLHACSPSVGNRISCQKAPWHNVNTLRLRQNGRHIVDDTFKRIFLNENVSISIEISLKFVPKGPINNIPALVQIMAWRHPGDKPLSEPMMVRLPTHICVTRPQWVNSMTWSPLWAGIKGAVHATLTWLYLPGLSVVDLWRHIYITIACMGADMTRPCSTYCFNVICLEEIEAWQQHCLASSKYDTLHLMANIW